MRPRPRTRSILAAPILVTTFALLSVQVFAQAPQPSPTQAPPAQSLADNIAALSVRASNLLPVLQSEFVAHLMSWVDGIAVGLAAVVLLYSFARLWREAGGVGVEAVWWCVRLGVCLFLLGSGPYIVNQLYLVGREIAEGGEMKGAGGGSLLFEFYQAQRESFNESYQKFSEGHFTVDVQGETLELEGAPSNTSTGGLLGVVYDTEATVKDIDRKLDVTSYNMEMLFSLFNAGRAIVDGGNFWLIILGAILMVVAKLLAPFAVAVAIDQKLAQKFTYPYVWGVMVLTLFWPAVSYTLRALAYFFGNIAMATGDSEPLYVWHQVSMTAIRSPMQHPAYTLVIAAFCMTVTGAMLWVSPFVTAWLVAGKFYEGVSQVASGFAGAIIGTGVETYSQSAAEAVRTHAAKMQADAGYQADVTRSTGEYQGANLATRARQTMAVAGVRGNQAAQLGQIYAARTNQVMSAQAGMMFGVNSASATAALSKSETHVRTAQGIGDLYAERAKGSANIENNRRADTQRWYGDKLIMGSDYLGRTVRGDGKQGSTRSTAGAAIEMLGGAAGLHQQHQSIGSRADGQHLALDVATEKQITNRQDAARGQYANQDAYLSRMTQYHKEYAAGQTAAANASAGQAAGGVNRGAAVQIGGINRGTGMEMQGNKVRFDSQVKASDITRDAAVQAAKLHALSNVMSRVVSKIAQEIEQGMAKHGVHY